MIHEIGLVSDLLSEYTEVKTIEVWGQYWTQATISSCLQ
jgi:hypothetical protein